MDVTANVLDRAIDDMVTVLALHHAVARPGFRMERGTFAYVLANRLL